MIALEVAFNTADGARMGFGPVGVDTKIELLVLVHDSTDLGGCKHRSLLSLNVLPIQYAQIPIPTR
jgi:hypothetical protein